MHSDNDDDLLWLICGLLGAALVVAALAKCNEYAVRTTQADEPRHEFNQDPMNSHSWDSLGGARCTALVPNGEEVVLVWRKPCQRT